MKTLIQKLLGTGILGLALISHSLPVWAGQTILPEVEIGPTFARGSMAGARYSADSQQHITCILHSPAVSCSARDKTGKYFFCQKIDPYWVAAAKAITDFSYVSINRSSTGTCTTLTIENHSSHLK